MDNKDKGPPDAKQQISERIKEVSNILVTVSKNPTVDELSAALGLTLILNKLDKHATAVFSGAIPPAIEFLEPDKTLENNVDSLRDFIIAIDKEKADRLRYKVEGEVVRIFITPYRTNISQEDLEFTHGDFNVELVLALGVESQDVLDEAIAAHGKILHDATVVTINAQNKTSTLGSIDWRDENASSLSEMLVALGESLKGGLLDEQIATALLTGIVAATDRFSNNKTSSKSMTIAAQLMAAGANQQLIASKLESASEISVSGTPQPDGSVKLDEGKSGKIRDEAPVKEGEALGQIQIEHGEDSEEAESAQLPLVEAKTIEEHDKANKQNAGEEALDAALEKLGATADTKSTDNLQSELAAVAEKKAEKPRTPLIGHSKPSGIWNDPNLDEPSMGGVINATAQEVSDKKKHEEDDIRNKTILSHDGATSAKGKDIQKAVDNLPTSSSPTPTVMDIQVTTNEPKSGTLADIEAGIGAHQADDQLSEASLPPIPPPPLPDFSNLPPLPPTVPTPLESVRTSAPSTIPPPQKTADATAAPVPDQFKIPGQ
ncbi:MAG: hypothetical protein AAB395_03015 [Patescibacteria group bacterium]